jgi:hypothetical protein
MLAISLPVIWLLVLQKMYISTKMGFFRFSLKYLTQKVCFMMNIIRQITPLY